MLARFRPRLTFANVVSLLALFIALGGGAYAASKFVGKDGRIHGCVTSKGKLTLTRPGHKCRKGKAIAWNQRGPRGAAGRNSARSVVVRTKNAALHYTSCIGSSPNFTCTGSASDTAPCNPGERAVGGGSGQPADGSTATVQETQPSPTTGTPTGWTVTVATSGSSTTNPPPDSTVPVYADCAAP